MPSLLFLKMWFVGLKLRSCTLLSEPFPSPLNNKVLSVVVSDLKDYRLFFFQLLCLFQVSPVSCSGEEGGAIWKTGRRGPANSPVESQLLATCWDWGWGLQNLYPDSSLPKSNMVHMASRSSSVWLSVLRSFSLLEEPAGISRQGALKALVTLPFLDSVCL